MTAYRLDRFLLALLTVLALAPFADSAAGRPRCTIRGTAHSDSIRGTPHRDVICSGPGDDKVQALGGRDLVRGGPGDDRLRGGSGDDRVVAGDGEDDVLGGAGIDDIYGDLGDDGLVGGLGGDYVEGDEGNDRCDYGDLEDALDTSCVVDVSVRSLEITPAAVDTYGGDAHVHVETTIRDVSNPLFGRTITGVRAATGFGGSEPYQSFAYGVPWTPGEELTRAPGVLPELGDRESTWSGDLTVPRYSPQGTHTISLLVEYTDALGSSALGIWWRGLERAKLPYTFEQVGRGGGDRPAVEDLTLTPRRVDVSTSPAEIAVRLHLHGGPREVKELYVSATPAGQTSGRAARMALSEGDQPDGIWTGKLPIPARSTPGRWLVTVSVKDVDDIATDFDPEDLERLGIDPSLQVDRSN
ncbi:MAG: hypothetical protein QOI10_3259 [Solirubrobacterales bacterium]|jgi:hypothetical protein|nr:hypothetical protein [Solirubrobacterales bacterium]